MDEKRILDGWRDVGAKVVERPKTWGSGGDVVGPGELELTRVLGEMGIREMPRGFGPKVKMFKEYFNREAAPRIGTKLRLKEDEEIDEMTAVILKKFMEGGAQGLKRPFDTI